MADPVLALRRRCRRDADPARRHRRGLRSRLFGVFVEAIAPFKALLDIPDDVDVACCITVGKPADDSDWDRLTSRLTQARKTVDDLVHWERWTRAS